MATPFTFGCIGLARYRYDGVIPHQFAYIETDRYCRIHRFSCGTEFKIESYRPSDDTWEISSLYAANTHTSYCPIAMRGINVVFIMNNDPHRSDGPAMIRYDEQEGSCLRFYRDGQIICTMELNHLHPEYDNRIYNYDRDGLPNFVGYYAVSWSPMESLLSYRADGPTRISHDERWMIW